MSVHTWLLFAFAYLLTTLTPGPNVLLVVRNTVRHGARGTVVSILGNLLVQLVVVTLVALGVGALLAAMPPLFVALKLAGAAYLILIGIRQWREGGRPAAGANAAAPGEAVPAVVPVSRLRLFRESILVAGSNPKTMIFLSAFMPQFIDHQRSLPLQFAQMYLTIALLVLVVHTIYSTGVRHLHGRLRAGRAVAAMRRMTGLVFVGFGVELLTAKQP
ncbi:LysE family translocator [Burkholderia gladioli]|uniref:LysE family translocator n=1 Tax=Burkholderia gladioli TaxID=28095 RepID=UPI0006273A37|nr:LysE family translocator [Burkholderia gladioli]KAF1064419.1 Homoserine/homoserine lactone efflux protein [Burkholderia gladioli]KKJ07072.1 lysine transporter LysE [Burkholderia gladioli]MBA1360508.1 LysE family translocator [Burkholderia gladioli]MBJ9674746.1 LysE family translocator [Burkholderia gladioli]MBU9176278.1 LysE family translocator [Burkholderia gladioli]